MPTNRDIVFKELGLPKTASPSVEELAELTDLPLEALLEVGKRGAGAWRTNISSVRLKKDFSKNPDVRKYPRASRLTQQHWATARIYSFIAKGKTFYTADADIARRYNLG
jgi:hypothetical protein